MSDAVPDLSGLLDTPVGIEAARLQQGEPWFASEIAGLQFYRYDARDELTGQRLRPQPGDRLHLVRDPENEYDANAIQTWWRNEHMLGHLPRYAAAQVAPLLDAGSAARAYVMDPGDGEAWSLRALVVGAAATPLYERHIEHVVRDALEAPMRPKRERRLQRRAERFSHILQAHRRRRLADAAEVLMAVPFEPVLPPVGSRIDLSDLARDLACSDSTVDRIGNRLCENARVVEGSPPGPSSQRWHRHPDGMRIVVQVAPMAVVETIVLRYRYSTAFSHSLGRRPASPSAGIPTMPSSPTRSAPGPARPGRSWIAPPSTSPAFRRRPRPMSEAPRSFVDGLYQLDVAETRRRLAEALAVARVGTDGDAVRRVEAALLRTSRWAIRHLADALAEAERQARTPAENLADAARREEEPPPGC